MSDIDDRAYRRDFYAAADQRQALDARQSPYYVPIYDRPELKTLDLVARLRDAIDFSGGESAQLLSGFRGCGKTSELLRLADELRVDGRPTVYFDIEDYLNTEVPLEFGVFPIVLAAGFVAGLGQAGDALAESLRDRLLSFMRRIKVEPTISAGAGPVEVQIALGLRDDTTLTKRVAEFIATNRRTFRAELHGFFEAASQRVDPSTAPVFIVDSIDHFRGRLDTFDEVRESVDRVFSEMVDDLRLPGIHVIYTTPVHVQSNLGIRQDILNIKVSGPDGTRFGPGRDALREVLRQRAPHYDLARLVADDGERIIEQSGGLFRDLLRITSQLLLIGQTLPANDTEIARAEMVVRNDFDGTLTAEQMAILRVVDDTHQLTPARAEWADAMDLVARGAVMRYANGERAWHGVHPLLKPLL